MRSFQLPKPFRTSLISFWPSRTLITLAEPLGPTHSSFSRPLDPASSVISAKPPRLRPFHLFQGSLAPRFSIIPGLCGPHAQPIHRVLRPPRFHSHASGLDPAFFLYAARPPGTPFPLYPQRPASSFYPQNLSAPLFHFIHNAPASFPNNTCDLFFGAFFHPLRFIIK